MEEVDRSKVVFRSNLVRRQTKRAWLNEISSARLSLFVFFIYSPRNCFYPLAPCYSLLLRAARLENLLTAIS